MLVIANSLLGPINKVLVEHEPPETKMLRKIWYAENMAKLKPRIILLGNSILDESVDENQLSRIVRAKTTKVWNGGAASAWWYLAMKNVIIQAPSKPRFVLIFFRDHILTDPTYRVTGDYKKKIDEMTEKQEPLLDRLAYLPNTNAITYLLLRYSPLYQKRNKVKAKLETAIKDRCVSALTGSGPGTADKAIERTFAEKNLNQHLLTIRQLAAEAATNDNQYNFSAQLNHSFLPHIIEIAKQNNIQLIFVRMKTRRDTEPDKEPKALRQYIEDLKDYLAENQTQFIDFTYDPSIKLEHFGAGDHLNRNKGRRLFTRLLAQKIYLLIQNDLAYTNPAK